MAQPINSEQINYLITLENEKGEPLKNQSITAVNLKEKTEKHERFTNNKGRAKLILRRGETYQITYFDKKYEAKIPTKGNSFLTKKLVYTISSISQLSTSSDTIFFKNKPLKPTATEAVLQIIIKDKNRKLIPNQKIWLVQDKIDKTYFAITNAKGQATFLLPIDYDYQVNFEKDANYKTISVPKMPYLNFRKGFTYHSNFIDIKEEIKHDTIIQTIPISQKATKSRVLILVTVLDLDQQPLADENVYLQGINKVYQAKTNADGKAVLMLPKDGYYAINFEYRDSLEVVHFEKGNYTRTDKVRYQYIGTKAIRARIRERERNQALWDSLTLVQSFRDSLAASRSDYSGFCYKLRSIPNPDLIDLIEKRAAEDLKNVQENPKYFEEIGDDAMSALYRNRNKWDNKLIITDLTCSMYPHLDQVLSWHILEMELKNKAQLRNNYMFFNDGDGKSMAEKILGATGGFHYTNAEKLETLLRTMQETMSTGCSIDGPENDMEALLDAANNRSYSDMEIILIADNNSEIRDFELLKSLKVPIRVVLAGTFWGVNEQYLELAFHTKGSVHTLEQDLEELYELNDGESINIGNETYRISGGKFIKISRM